MMHEIKFRVWDYHEKHMYYPHGEDIEMFIECFSVGRIQTNNILMQFTGLKDKDGKEIYEGDIIECFKCDSIDFRNVVEFKNGAFGYCSGKYMFISFSENYNFEFKNGASEKIEIIGNIYEDKDILIHEQIIRSGDYGKSTINT